MALLLSHGHVMTLHMYNTHVGAGCTPDAFTNKIVHTNVTFLGETFSGVAFQSALNQL